MTPDWLLAAVPTYRAAGFFAQHEFLSDRELAEWLDAEYWETWGTSLASSALEPAQREIELLCLDVERTWHDDREADVCEENQAYAEVLRNWAEISLGTFNPETISERWTGPAESIRVDLSIDGEVHQLRPRAMGEYLDVDGLARQLNSVLAHLRAPRRVATLETDDQSAFVTFLSPEERQLIESARGLQFGLPPLPVADDGSPGTSGMHGRGEESDTRG
jgi:hypothetical protein